MSEAQPSYRTGQSVRVVPGARNNTPRRGMVITIRRHFKDECFDYYIRECGRQVSKRYRDDDLLAETANPAWLTSTVIALTAGIVADRAFDRLPILADALEEVGCDDVDVLTHCRGHKQHKQGCWVVDLVLSSSS